MPLPILALCALLSAVSAQAASISVDLRGADKPALVSIQGTLILNDDEEFRARTASLSQAVVAFESNGGNLLAGIRIGTLIRTRGFATLVRAGSQCASACALAWLGGTVRHMDDGAKIGFHSAFRNYSGLRVGSAAGNAFVGAYLNQLGLRPDAVNYVTKSGPGSITWLTVGDAKRLGFEVTRLDRGIWPSFGTSGNSASAPANQGRLSIRTRGAVYAIEQDLDGSPICVTKDGNKLFCPAGTKVRFGNIARTKDFEVLPVFTSCRGSGCVGTGTTLIIEKDGEAVVNGSLGEYCLECSEETVQVNQDANQVRFVLEGTSGEQITAKLQNGVVLIAPLRPLSIQTLNQEQCTFVYGQLGECSRARSCSAPYEMMPTSPRVRLQKIMDEHPWFPGESYLRQCIVTCRNQANIDRSLFSSQFCNW
jgi:hypothetical protein